MCETPNLMIQKAMLYIYTQFETIYRSTSSFQSVISFDLFFYVVTKHFFNLRGDLKLTTFLYGRQKKSILVNIYADFLEHDDFFSKIDVAIKISL